MYHPKVIVSNQKGESISASGIFLCSQGLKFGAISNGIYVTFFLILKKNPNLEKKCFFWKFVIFFLFFFLKIGIFIQSTHTDATW